MHPAAWAAGTAPGTVVQENDAGLVDRGPYPYPEAGRASDRAGQPHPGPPAPGPGTAFGPAQRQRSKTQLGPAMTLRRVTPGGLGVWKDLVGGWRFRAGLCLRRSHIQTSSETESCLVRCGPVSYTHLRAHETRHDLVCRL